MRLSSLFSRRAKQNNPPHRFIVVEGIDGAGTTTLSKAILKRFKDANVPVVWTCEPTHDLHVGKLIRRMLRKEIPVLGSHDLAVMFTADRIDHLESVIKPALADGKVVICDRYYYSTMVYQHLTSNATDSAWFMSMCKTSSIMAPDITIVVDVTPSVAWQRINTRESAKELFERRDVQALFGAQYKILESFFPKDFIVHVDGDKNARDVELNAFAALWRLQHAYEDPDDGRLPF